MYGLAKEVGIHGAPDDRQSLGGKICDRGCVQEPKLGGIGGVSVTSGCTQRYGKCKYSQGTRTPPRVKKVGRIGRELGMPFQEELMHPTADEVDRLLKTLVPDAHATMTQNTASSCRIGKNPGGAIAGMTATADYAAHYHYDSSNLPRACRETEFVRG